MKTEEKDEALDEVAANLKDTCIDKSLLDSLNTLVMEDIDFSSDLTLSQQFLDADVEEWCLVKYKDKVCEMRIIHESIPHLHVYKQDWVNLDGKDHMM